MLSAVIITCPAPQKAHLGVTGTLVWIQPSQLISSCLHSKAAQPSGVCGAVQGCEDAAKIQEFVACEEPAEAGSLPMVTLLATGQALAALSLSATLQQVFLWWNCGDGKCLSQCFISDLSRGMAIRSCWAHRESCSHGGESSCHCRVQSVTSRHLLAFSLPLLLLVSFPYSFLLVSFSLSLCFSTPAAAPGTICWGFLYLTGSFGTWKDP